ncbi:hypothetical protein LTR36_000270 [Oleoguttula mirabilis]|uniref:Uncharacterized protein n=1 Tax=Oleoguttula mirabilis TaxID=1507867 RepID=A0AAV9JYN1_9PEZI|nr:hypothetical protein LTR36_000270 [Oleoguttula mirabilis]
MANVTDCDDRDLHKGTLKTPCNRRQANCTGSDDLHGYAKGNRKDATQVIHQAAWLVCRDCERNRRAQPFYKQFLAYLKKLPPQDETKKWRGYWTRLCTECQIREQVLLNERRGRLGPGGIALIGTPPPDNAAQMARYPRNNCNSPQELKLMCTILTSKVYIEDHLRKLDQATRDRYTDIKVWLTFTKRFSELPENEQEARLKQWLHYRLQSKVDNAFVPLEILVRHMGKPCDPVRQFFNQMIYKGNHGEHMSEIVAALQDTFEVELTHKEWPGLESEGKDQIDADAVVVNASSGSRVSLARTGGQ